MLKLLWLLILLAILSGNVTMTLINDNYWPFCSYNMFFFNAPQNIKRLKVELIEERGDSQVVDPGNIFPIEFFKANGTTALYFGDSACLSREDQINMSRLIINRLNKNPWREFDETYMPAKKIQSDICKIRILLVEYDFNRYNFNEEFEYQVVDTLINLNFCSSK